MGSFTESLHLAWDMATRWDPALWQVVALSLQVSGTATLIGAAIGLLAGAWLAVARFPGHRLVVVVLNTLLALPSVVVGLVVYLLLSRQGPLGPWGILFTPTAMVLAQAVLVVPVVTALTRQLIADAAHGNGEQLRSLGARPVAVAGLLLLHERWALLTVLLTAFGRAVSEVGAVMIVGGNIAGVTRVMTTTIALETSKGDLPLALGLGIVLLSVVALINLGIALLQWLQREQEAAGKRSSDDAAPAGAAP
jgi:ABC-type tungstate transport system substrate-binding protein